MVNASELIDQPLNTILSPYTALMGGVFWLVPISIIAGALFMKTKNITVVGTWLLGAGMFMGGVNLFSGFPVMLDFYGAIIVIGIVMIIPSVIMRYKAG